MKPLFLSFLLINLTTLYSQSFINQYTPTCLWPLNGDGFSPTITEMRFSCITDKSSNLLIAGPCETVSKQRFGLNLTEINQSGYLVDMHIIGIDDNTVPIYPTGILWESEGYAIICGYTGEFGYHDYADVTKIPHAFILKYNYSTHTVDWVTKFVSNYTYFFDIAKRPSDGNYVICGQFSTEEFQDSEDALMYIANATTGTLTLLEEAKALTTIHSSDTWYALDISVDNVFAASRMEYYKSTNGGGYAGMRGGLSKLNMVTYSFATRCYLRQLDLDNETIFGRLYAIDLAKAGKTQYVVAMQGDLDNGTYVDQDLCIVKTDANLLSSWQRSFSFPSVAQNGTFNSIKTYSPAKLSHIIVYGTYHDDQKPFISRISPDGNTVQWCYKYDNMKSPSTHSPNSLLVLGDNIYAVGWDNSGTAEVGVLLKTNVNDGSADCSEVLYPTLTVLYQDYPTDPYNIYVSPDQTNPLKEAEGCNASKIGCLDVRLGQEEYTSGAFQLINDTHNQVTLILNDFNSEKNYNLKIYNLMGQLIQSEIIRNKSINLILESGIYIFQLQIDNTLTDLNKFLIK